MTKRDVIKTTTFLTPHAADVGLSRRVRERMLEGAEPASTLIFVPGLARPDFLIEIEAIAAAE
jgi:enamine deaminase RidA (YjgF/YER057c/UK114 family)